MSGFRLRDAEQLEEVNEYFMTKRYKARVPTVALMDPEEIAIFGFYQQYDMYGKPMLMTNNPEDTNRVKVEVMWTLPKLVETYFMGYPISITESDENALEMFRNLEAYVEYNKTAHTLSLNKMDSNVEVDFSYKVEHFLEAFLETNKKTLEYENRYKYRHGGFTLGIREELIGGALNQSDDQLTNQDQEDDKIRGASNLSWRFQQ